MKAALAQVIRPFEQHRTIPSGDVGEIMLEQLEYLIEHAEAGSCGCSACIRYALAKTLLLQVFES
jgi:hypothetical protein